MDVIDFTTIDVGAAYRTTRQRILGLVEGLTDAQWNMRVPHCPDWTIRETLAHLAGVCDDGINGRMDGVATEAWTAAQVSKRVEMAGPEIATEWATWGPFVDARGTEIGLRLSQLLFDTVTHEHDLRYALAKPGERESDGLTVALAFLASRLAVAAPATGHRLVLRIRTADGQVVEAFDSSGATSLPSITLTASTFDAVRSFGSRRTLAEICALDWSSDPSDLIRRVAPFALPASNFNE